MWSKSNKNFIIACKILLQVFNIKLDAMIFWTKLTIFPLNVLKVKIWVKTLKCSWNLRFWLDTASSMLIFVDCNTYVTFSINGTVYPMKHCEPSHWAAKIFHEMELWSRARVSKGNGTTAVWTLFLLNVSGLGKILGSLNCELFSYI